MTLYILLKSIHMGCALLSVTSFIVRGVWMFTGSALLTKKIVKVAPHLIDTIFLLSGLSLVFLIDSGLLGQAWLLTKILLLVVYIALGIVALKPSVNSKIKIAAFVSALLVFIYIVGVAVSKNPASWFSIV
ncbi:SirB2 family protein [Gammaproteobacteria bacterium]|nr:SirB2 family protein [Gammaproteobacteria bacterium]